MADKSPSTLLILPCHRRDEMKFFGNKKKSKKGFGHEGQPDSLGFSSGQPEPVAKLPRRRIDSVQVARNLTIQQRNEYAIGAAIESGQIFEDWHMEE